LFATAALRFGAFAFAAYAGLLVESPLFHFLEHAFLGELALEHAHRLVERPFDSNFHNPPWLTNQHYFHARAGVNPGAPILHYPSARYRNSIKYTFSPRPCLATFNRSTTPRKPDLTAKTGVISASVI